MSLHRLPSQSADEPPLAPPCTLVVRRASGSVWDVSTPDHRVGGSFASLEAARRFARGEARSRPRGDIVIFDSDAVEIEEFSDHHLCATARYGLPASAPAAGAMER